MASALAHLELKEGDFKYMGKLSVTHVSGDLENLGFDISANTQAILHKDTTRKGKRLFHKYGLSLKNEETGENLSIDLASKPGNGVIYGTLNVSAWDMRRRFARTDHCTVEFEKNTVEIVFFKEMLSKGRRFKVDRNGEILKDQGAVFDAIKYLKLDASRV